MRIRLFAVVILATVLADQLTKAAAVAWLQDRDSVEVIPGFFWFTLVRNSGAAFSLGAGFTWIFSLLGIAAVGFIFWHVTRIKRLIAVVSLALLQGGIIGNLLDRLFQPPYWGSGHVIDFLSFPHLLKAIFNLADVFIVLGVLGYVFFASSKPPAAASDDADAAEDGDVGAAAGESAQKQ